MCLYLCVFRSCKNFSVFLILFLKSLDIPKIQICEIILACDGHTKAYLKGYNQDLQPYKYQLSFAYLISMEFEHERILQVNLNHQQDEEVYENP